jgi:hypothetical protein
MDQDLVHILLVQDSSSGDPVLVGLLDDVLGRNYRLSHVNRLEQAQEVLADSSVDCILLDLQLSAGLGRVF